MLPVAISSLGIGIPEAIAMVTSIPATAARLDDVGRIAPGARADFALFDADLTVTGVALAGEWQPRSSR
jgi:N-acetylglucosamine-6-phosphate deacetylase